MRHFIASICMSLGLIMPAAADNPYVVAGVGIDATADNAVEAQTQAMRAGQLAAARELIERLTLPEDRFETGLDFEPRLDEETGEIVEQSVLTEALAAEMISGIRVFNEQASATRYIADLTVSFDERAVASMLRSMEIPYVEAQSRPMVVLPVYVTSDGDFLLWDDNPWRAAWEQDGFEHALTPVVLPDAGAARSLISPREALQANEGALAQVAAAYGTNRVAVLRAQDRQDSRRMGGYVVTLNGDAPASMEVWGPETLYLEWADIAWTFVQEREAAWKRQTIVRNAEIHDMTLTVLYGGHQEWLTLQSVLTGASLIENAQLDALSRDGALMSVSYRGELEQLVSELEERGAALEEHPDVGWIVRSTY